jgi:hypothetical protein
MSPALLSLLSYSPINAALELHRSLTNTTHPFPPPIAPGNLAGDPTAVGAHHLAVDRPSQSPSGQIGPTSVIPYLRPCLATTPSTQNRDRDGEPPWSLTDGRTPAGSPPPPSPPNAVPSPLAGTWTCAHGAIPALSPAGGPARPSARARARALGWAEIHPPPRPS